MTSNTIISVTAGAFCVLALGWLEGGHWSRWCGYALWAVGAASCVLIVLMAWQVWQVWADMRQRRQVRTMRRKMARRRTMMCQGKETHYD